jgi:hypothetical protein
VRQRERKRKRKRERERERERERDREETQRERDLGMGTHVSGVSGAFFVYGSPLCTDSATCFFGSDKAGGLLQGNWFFSCI